MSRNISFHTVANSLQASDSPAIDLTNFIAMSHKKIKTVLPKLKGHPSDYLVYDYIFINTIGAGNKVADLTYYDFMRATGLTLPTIGSALKRLSSLSLIVINKHKNKANTRSYSVTPLPYPSDSEILAELGLGTAGGRSLIEKLTTDERKQLELRKGMLTPAEKIQLQHMAAQNIMPGISTEDKFDEMVLRHKMGAKLIQDLEARL